MDPDPFSCIVNLVATIAQATTSQAAITFQAPTMSSWIALATAFLGLFFSAFNSGSEIAYFSLTSKDLEGIEDDAKRSRIQHLLDQPERLLASILIGNNLVNIMIVIVLNFAMNQMFTFNSSIANFLIQTVILTFLILLFGEVIISFSLKFSVRFAPNETYSVVSWSILSIVLYSVYLLSRR